MFCLDLAILLRHLSYEAYFDPQSAQGKKYKLSEEAAGSPSATVLSTDPFQGRRSSTQTSYSLGNLTGKEMPAVREFSMKRQRTISGRENHIVLKTEFPLKIPDARAHMDLNHVGCVLLAAVHNEKADITCYVVEDVEDKTKLIVVFRGTTGGVGVLVNILTYCFLTCNYLHLIHRCSRFSQCEDRFELLHHRDRPGPRRSRG